MSNFADEFYSRLYLEENDESIEFTDEAVETDNQHESLVKFCVVRRIVSDRSFNFLVFKQTMASVWRPVKGMMMKDLGYNSFLVQFMHEVDMTQVVDGGPWNYMQNLLIIHRVMFGVNPRKVELNTVNFWIHVYNVIGLKTEKAYQEIGTCIGLFVEADAKNFSLAWRDFLRIKVSIDVRKPLRRRLKIKLPQGEWTWVEFKYERLTTFCYFCGIIGHSDKFCSKLMDYPGVDKSQFVYGSWIRANDRRGGRNVGERWLITEEELVYMAKKTGCAEKTQMEQDLYQEGFEIQNVQISKSLRKNKGKMASNNDTDGPCLLKI